MRHKGLKLGIVFAAMAVSMALASGRQGPQLSDSEKQIENQMAGLRSMPDGQRATVTRQLALEIRRLPSSKDKLMLAYGLANLSTEGDFGRNTLQQVTTTLSESLAARPPVGGQEERSFACYELAQLALFEHMKVGLNTPEYATAVSKLASIEKARHEVDFTLHDVDGGTWTLSALKGKVVLVNFWATWCPPCRKEMPDLQALYNEFQNRGLVILAISDEDVSKVDPFIAKNKYTFPILLDPGRKVNTKYQIEGIPKTFIYDRNGNMVAETIDMRTRAQFLKLLAKVGLKPQA